MGTSGKERQRAYRERNKERINREKELKYQQRLRDGLCPRCGEPPDDKDYKICSECRDGHAGWWRDWKDRHKTSLRSSSRCLAC